MTTSWPKSLDTIHGSAEQMCQRVGQLTDGKFLISTFAGGEIVPGTQVFDAVSKNTVECGHTLSAFYFGKNPVYAFDSGVAFGANSRQQAAWLYYGGGLELLREIFRKEEMLNFPCGNTGRANGRLVPQEITRRWTISRASACASGGLSGTVLQRLGAVPTQIAPGDIYPSLERGTIDARNGSVPTTTEARLRQGREVLLHARLVGRLRDDHHAGQRQGVGSAACAVQGPRSTAANEAEPVDAGKIRRAKPGSPEAARGGRHRGCGRSRSP